MCLTLASSQDAVRATTDSSGHPRMVGHTSASSMLLLKRRTMSGPLGLSQGVYQDKQLLGSVYVTGRGCVGGGLAQEMEKSMRLPEVVPGLCELIQRHPGALPWLLREESRRTPCSGLSFL